MVAAAVPAFLNHRPLSRHTQTQAQALTHTPALPLQGAAGKVPSAACPNAKSYPDLAHSQAESGGSGMERLEGGQGSGGQVGGVEMQPEYKRASGAAAASLFSQDKTRI